MLKKKIKTPIITRKAKPPTLSPMIRGKFNSSLVELPSSRELSVLLPLPEFPLESVPFVEP